EPVRPGGGGIAEERETPVGEPVNDDDERGDDDRPQDTAVRKAPEPARRGERLRDVRRCGALWHGGPSLRYRESRRARAAMSTPDPGRGYITLRGSPRMMATR